MKRAKVWEVRRKHHSGKHAARIQQHDQSLGPLVDLQFTITQGSCSSQGSKPSLESLRPEETQLSMGTISDKCT